MTINRRSFLKGVFQIGGIAALYSLGGSKLVDEALADQNTFISGHLAAGYQYYKVQVVVGSGDKTYGALWEIEMNIGGVDQTTTGQAIYGSEHATNTAAKAFDNNEGATKWSPLVGAADADTWVGQNFGSSKGIDTVRVKAEYGSADPAYVSLLKIYADSQADFSTGTLLKQQATGAAGAWYTITL